MDSGVFTAISKDSALPLPSLRLLVPPMQLMTAWMWQVLKRQDVMNYWNVAEFVSLVMDIVPELLMYKHRTQLNLGLKARYILELCRCEQLAEPDLILSHLDKIKSQHPTQMEAAEDEKVAVHFLELIQALLKDPEERRNFFLEVFPVEYGAQYDSDLQTLFWEFLCRLAQLLPVPDLEQTMSWLGAEHSHLADCVHSLSKPADLKHLLQHHKSLGHLEQHVPPCGMGESILSSLSAGPLRKVAKTIEQPKSGSLQGLSDETQTVSFVDDVAVEIIMVTDYAEVELATSTDNEVIIGEHCYQTTDGGTEADVSLVLLPEKGTREEEADQAEGGGTQEKAESALIDHTFFQPEFNKDQDPASSQDKVSVGPHDCPDCEKKFQFASSLIAHRVIHTGERPHRCNDCGRCFSFRQSLDRHRHTHKTGRKYDCTICGETFLSLSARTEHKQTHMEDGVYMCQQCDKKFNWELAFARHLKTHTANKLTGSHDDECLSIKNVCKNPVKLLEPEVQLQTTASEKDPEKVDVQSNKLITCDSGGLVPEGDYQVASIVKIRTSGRKRKPTMKVQVINLQKSMNMKTKKIIKVNPPVLKPLPVSCVEHSYGSPVVSSKDSDGRSVADISSAALSCSKCLFHHSDDVRVRQHVDSVPSAGNEEDMTSLLLHPDEEGSFSCADCEKSFKFQSLLKAHQRIHTGEQPFLCSQCGRRFSFKQSLERHKQTHKSGRKYKCLICGEFFKSSLAQREHKSTHMENGEYLCSECGRAFTWKSALVRHLKIHGEDANQNDRSYKCPHCDLSFSCASYLNRHIQTHQEERVYTCNCGKSFAYQAALTAHQRIHLKERRHICTQCGKGFLYRGGLLSHMKIHSEEMPFICSFCGKSFKRERNMKKHERCHTRENVFSCSQCDKSFVYKATLIRHELTHSGERPYLCSDCGKGFFSHAELLKHERFHTGHKPFQCPHCGKKFTQSCYLTVHLRYHTGVRPYACTECDKTFLSANRLKRHQRTHSGEKPYLCGECGKGFRQAYNLKMHQRTHLVTLT